MILFDFSCTGCTTVFEELVYLDEPNPICPHCQCPTTKILLNSPSQPSDPRMSELSIKFRHSINKYKNSSKESRPTLDSKLGHGNNR